MSVRRCVAAVFGAIVLSMPGDVAMGQQPMRVRAPGPGAGGQKQDAPAARPPKAFRFDDGAWASRGLSFEFERGVSTVDDDGLAVGIDEPRFARSSAIASAGVLELVRPAQYGTTILGSGFDHNGETPILVVRDSALNVVDVFWSADVPLADATGVGRTRTSLGADGVVDILNGAVANRRYDPRAGIVCHGMIVLACSVSYQPVPPLSAWLVRSTAIVVSQDRGRTWGLLFEDAMVQENRERVREWSLQNWWPDGTEGPALTAYVAVADYRSKPGCNGGRVLAFRATRSWSGGSWLIDPPALVYETPVAGTGQHVHAAGIVPWGDGLRVVAGVGDTQAFNRVVAADRADGLLTGVGWTSHESFHGSMGTAGNQFVGCAPSATPGVLIVGSDLCQEQLMLLDARGATGVHTWLYGNGWANGLPSQNFVIRTPSPERGGPYCSTYDPQQNSEFFPPGSRRLLYSEDGIGWAQVAAPMTQSTWAAAVHAGYLYVDGEGVGKLGLRRVAVPEVMHTARPLRVGGGGMQRLSSSPAFNAGPGGTVTALVRNGEGLWEDGGVVLEPQPPSVGRVWKLTGTLGSSDTRIGDLFPVTTATLGQATGSTRMAGRVWVMNAMDKSLSARLELKPSGGAVIESRNLNISSTGAWAPVDFVVSAQMPAGQRPVVRVRSATGGSDVQAFYLATDAWDEGEGFSGYAMGPDLSARGDGTVYPDERAWISGFAASETWTVTLAGMLPFDGVDPSVQSKLGLRWPLASICVGEGTPSERLVIFADVEAHAMWAELWRGGAAVGVWRAEGFVWLRQSPVMISVARPGGASDLEISVAACGMGPMTMSRQDPDGSVRTFVGEPRMVRFDDGTGIDGAGMGVSVTPMMWFGGEILEDRALNEAERAARFRTLRFLRADATQR